MNQVTALSILAALMLGAVAYLETERGLFTPRSNPPAITAPVPEQDPDFAADPVAGPGLEPISEADQLRALTLAFGGDDDEPSADDSFVDQALDEMVERPLFNRSRRPAEVIVASTSGTAPREPDARELLRYTLIGTVIAGDRRVALLRSTQSPDVAQVKTGDDLQGWRLDKLDENAATFSRESRTVVLEIAPTF